MLGWFKKKFGKQTDVPQAVEPEQQEAAAAVEASVVAAPAEAPPPEPAVQPAVEEPEIVAPAGEVPPVEEPDAAVMEEVSGEETTEAMESADVVPAQPEVAEAEPEPLPQTGSEGEEAMAAKAADVESPPDAGAEQEGLETSEGPSTADDSVIEEPHVEEPEGAESAIPTESQQSSEPKAGRTQEKPAAKSLFQRLQERLGKTRDAFIYRLDRIFLGKKEIDQDLFEQLEELLITADLGVGTTLELLDAARKKVKREQLSDPQALKTIIRDQILAYIEASEQPAELVMPEEGPFVIMVVGVNGVGKTTTIGKLAAKFVRSGQSVLLIAADTFRAAAINQLKIWGERVGVDVIAQNPGADPSSVVFDGLEYGVSHQFDVIIIDTAGRLHTSVNLMEELKKIRRVIGKKMPGAPHEVLLVLDATTGQNGISQAKLFHEAVGVSGLALTKLDGTAKGGIVANVCREIKIPVRFIGIGEQIDDLRDFDAREFVDALFTSQEEG